MKRLVILAFALVSIFSIAAMADNLDDHTWHVFNFGGTGSEATDGSGSVDFFATGPTEIKVTDCCETGDQFTLYDNGVLLGTSSYVATGPGDGCPNADACYSDPLYSHGAWLVGAGVNDITIYMANSPWGSGGAYIEATTPSPEPGSLTLLGAGLLGALGTLRRKLNR